MLGYRNLKFEIRGSLGFLRSDEDGEQGKDDGEGDHGGGRFKIENRESKIENQRV